MQSKPIHFLFLALLALWLAVGAAQAHEVRAVPSARLK